MKMFLLRVLYKATKVLPFNNYLLTKISSLAPANFDDMVMLTLAKTYDNIILKEEYHKFYSEIQLWESNLPSLIQIYEKCDREIVKFYLNEDINKKYKAICKLAQTLLIFPHSTAEVERLFSQLKLIKTDKRANLKVETLESLLLLKYNNINLDDNEVIKEISKKHRKLKDEAAESKRIYRKRKASQITQEDSTIQEINISQDLTEEAKVNLPIFESLANHNLPILKKNKLSSSTKEEFIEEMPYESEEESILRFDFKSNFFICLNSSLLYLGIRKLNLPEELDELSNQLDNSQIKE